MKIIKTYLSKNKDLIFLLFLGFIIRLLLINRGTYFPDLYTFQEWSLALIRYPFNKFYSTITVDYLPGYMYFLWLTGKIYYFINAKLFYIPAEIVYKIPSLLADLLNALIVYAIINKISDRRKAIKGTAFFLFNIAFISNSVLWGQIDSVVATFILASLYFHLNGNLYPSILLASIGQTIKPVVVLVIPFYLLVLLKKRKFKQIIISLILMIIVYACIFIPFNNKNLVAFIIERNLHSIEVWKYTTLNAFNLWLVITSFFNETYNLISDQNGIFGLSYKVWGNLVFFLFYTSLLCTYFKNTIKKSVDSSLLFSYLMFIFLGMFHFMTRMHERHSYYGLIFATLLLTLTKNKVVQYLILILILLYPLNLMFSYEVSRGKVIFNESTVVFLSAINVLVFAFLFIKLLRNTHKLRSKLH
ncbi:DUF2029 domain-containing protein [Candidatus Woesebacteria bacterium]|nr:DUF2029 domain-containing protein [Candidatus Woesebacteria bacterium]